MSTSADRKAKILSFGCSTGEEIVTLRYLFPDADIYGCEIHPGTLNIAAQAVGHIATLFPSDGDAVRIHGPFDLINCSAVLCLNPPADIGSRFPSTQFEDLLSLLDGALVPGGLLAITNASYRFGDSPLAPGYDAIRADIVSSMGVVDIFSHDGRPFMKRARNRSDVIFRRGEAFALQDEEELVDALFRKRLPGEQPAPRTLRLSPVPEAFVADFEFRQSNLVGLSPAERAGAIEIVRRYRFGTDTATGQRGYTVQTSWDSFSNDRQHIRPPIWKPQGALL